MINLRLIITPKHFHFSQWEILEFRKHFKEVVEAKSPYRGGLLQENDVLLCYAYPKMMEYYNAKCRAKFCMLYPGWRFRPWHRQRVNKVQKVANVISQYQAIFVNDGPVWERLKYISNVNLVPFSADHNKFKKTRQRKVFTRIIQVARLAVFKGREISEAAMKLMPYEWELFPAKAKENYHVTTKSGYVLSWDNLVPIYQNADGFLSPNIIGPPSKYDVDAKYNQSTIEAGLSGCLIFWHDCMNLGNSFGTVFPISLDPKEIAQKIQDIVSSTDLDKYSTLTAQEFYEKCNAESAVKAKVEIMKRFL